MKDLAKYIFAEKNPNNIDFSKVSFSPHISLSLTFIPIKLRRLSNHRNELEGQMQTKRISLTYLLVNMSNSEHNIQAIFFHLSMTSSD